jgi:hypothetical protein
MMEAAKGVLYRSAFQELFRSDILLIPTPNRQRFNYLHQTSFVSPEREVKNLDN